MILQKHWEQIEPLNTLTENFFVDDLTGVLDEFIKSDRYKEYYSNHVVIEKYKNVARLFNKNTEEYIAIGFFKAEKLHNNTPLDATNIDDI